MDSAVIEVAASEAVEVSGVEIVVAMEIVVVVEDLAVATKWEEGWLKHLSILHSQDNFISSRIVWHDQKGASPA